MKMKSSLSREGIYYLFVVMMVLIGSVIREVNPMLLFAAFLCAPLVIAWRLGRRSLRGLGVRRRLPAQIFAGEPFVVHLELSNPRPKKRRWFGGISVSSWGIVVVDRIRRVAKDEAAEGDSPKPFEPAVYFEYIPNEQSRKKSYAGRLPRRGRYEVGPLMISTRFPFGFFRHWLEPPTASVKYDEFIVFPKLGKISGHWKARKHETIESRHRHRFRPSRISGEFLGVRRWQQGDSRKWIHWRASARHQVPVVRQFEQHENRDHAVLIDLFHRSLVDDEAGYDCRSQENFELAVSFTATLVSETVRQGGSRLYFATSHPADEAIFGSAGTPMVESVLYRLAKAEREREDALAEKLLQAVAMVDPSAELILVTPQPFEPGTSPRFDKVRHDPRFHAAMQRLRIVDTSDHALEKIFEV